MQLTYKTLPIWVKGGLKLFPLRHGLRTSDDRKLYQQLRRRGTSVKQAREIFVGIKSAASTAVSTLPR